MTTKIKVGKSLKSVKLKVGWFYGMSTLVELFNAEVFLQTIRWLQVTNDNNNNYS